MSDFLDTLKVRMLDAQRRFNEVNLRFQRTQAELQAIQLEYTSWQNAVKNESAKEQQELEAQTPGRPPSPTASAHIQTVTPNSISDVNKTDLIRGQLQQHPAGMTPAEVWRAVKAQVPQRSYVYSVLKRLKDREQVTTRRGKYYLRAASKLEEAKQEVVVQ